MVAVHRKVDFINQINSTFGSWGFICSFNDKELAQYRAVVGGPAGQAMAGPVFSLSTPNNICSYKALLNCTAAYASNLSILCLEF